MSWRLAMPEKFEVVGLPPFSTEEVGPAADLMGHFSVAAAARRAGATALEVDIPMIDRGFPDGAWSRVAAMRALNNVRVDVKHASHAEMALLVNLCKA